MLFDKGSVPILRGGGGVGVGGVCIVVVTCNLRSSTDRRGRASWRVL